MSMSDRELLELVAKAKVCLNGFVRIGGRSAATVHLIKSGGGGRPMQFSMCGQNRRLKWFYRPGDFEFSAGDGKWIPVKITKKSSICRRCHRAIVRAAAEIGRTKP